MITDPIESQGVGLMSVIDSGCVCQYKELNALETLDCNITVLITAFWSYIIRFFYIGIPCSSVNHTKVGPFYLLGI